MFEQAVLLNAAGMFTQTDCKLSIHHVQPTVLFPFRKATAACKSIISVIGQLNAQILVL